MHGQIRIRNLTLVIRIFPRQTKARNQPPIPCNPTKSTLSGILNEVRPGTEFTLNWIPFGGFNKVKGEDDPDATGGMASANPWKRIAVLLAGAAMNLLTAVVVYTIFFSQIGIPDSHTVVIASVAPSSPAEQAGIQAGDVVLAAGGLPINSYTRLIEYHPQFPGTRLSRWSSYATGSRWKSP